MNLNNKTIVITGANGGLGREVSRKALEYGATLVLLDLVFPDEAKSLEGDVTYIEIDLLNAESVEEQLSQLEQIDAVMNLAGGFSMGPTVHEVSDKDWDFLFNINVNTMRNVVSAVVPKMIEQQGGAIVNVGALGAIKGAGNMGAYCASKSVVMRLTESLSEELKHKGINVNAVLPSIIDTPANRSAMPDADPSKWVTPEQLGEVICFLASDAAKAVHGALVPVAGLS